MECSQGAVGRQGGAPAQQRLRLGGPLSTGPILTQIETGCCEPPMVISTYVRTSLKGTKVRLAHLSILKSLPNN